MMTFGQSSPLNFHGHHNVEREWGHSQGPEVCMFAIYLFIYETCIYYLSGSV